MNTLKKKKKTKKNKTWFNFRKTKMGRRGEIKKKIKKKK